jgi:hypothetical protein
MEELQACFDLMLVGGCERGWLFRGVEQKSEKLVAVLEQDYREFTVESLLDRRRAVIGEVVYLQSE